MINKKNVVKVTAGVAVICVAAEAVNLLISHFGKKQKDFHITVDNSGIEEDNAVLACGIGG